MFAWLERAELSVVVDEDQLTPQDGDDHVGCAVAIYITKTEGYHCQVLSRPDQLSGVGILERRQRDRHICYHGRSDHDPREQEECHVSPESIIAMGTNRVKAAAALESSASACASVMELWDGVSQVVWHHQCGGLAGRLAGNIAVDAAPTIARVVLRCPR